MPNSFEKLKAPATFDPDPMGSRQLAALGNLVAARRVAIGCGMRELGRKTGVSASTISRFERGKQEISVVAFLRICRALNCTVAVNAG